METVPYMEKGIVIPVHNVVLLPGVSTMIYYSQASVQLQEALKQEDAKFVVLPLKRDVAIGDINAEDFHRYGVVFTSGRLSSNDKGTYLSARLMNRVRVESTRQENGQWIAEYISDPEQMDLDEKGMEQILTYIRQTVSEIAGHFKNGQMYMKLLDEIHDLNTVIAYLSQFLSLSAQEKYELLEMSHISGFVNRARGTGRPTKKERRDLDEFTADSGLPDFLFDMGDDDDE